MRAVQAAKAVQAQAEQLADAGGAGVDKSYHLNKDQEHEEDETMNLDFSDHDYYLKPSKLNFNRTRRSLKPLKLSFPLKYCNYEELRDYLGIELLQHHNKRSRKGF